MLVSARISRQHLTEEFVRHTSFDEFIFGEYSIVILIHLGEYFLGSFLRRVRWVEVGQRWSDHVVDRLINRNRIICHALLSTTTET